MDIISFKKTVVGWYNFTSILFRYNIDPETFRSVTGVSEQATMGTCELTTQELAELERNATYIGLADGWEMFIDYDKAGEITEDSLAVTLLRRISEK